MPRTVLLIDGNSLTYRAFFALPTDLATASGQVTNAVFGFTSMLINIIRDHPHDGIAVALGRFREMQALFDQNTSLEEQLETRKVVDRAKGLLMDGHGLTEADAFSWIQKRAMQDRRTMRAVAEQVIAGELTPDS